MHRLRIIAAALTVAALAAAGAHGQMGGPVQIYMEPAEARSIRRAAELAGVAEARRHSTLSAETAGRVEKMLVDAGDFAAAGAPVCQMRRLPVELQLKQAEGQLASAQAQLKKAEQGFRVEEVQQAEARVKAAKAAFELARQDQERTLRLLKDGASTPAERDAVDAAYRQAKEQLAEAEAGLALVRSGSRIEDIDSARAAVATQMAAVELLKDTLGKMTVAMPFDGYVVRKCTEEGEWLNPGVPVVEVSDLGVVRIQVDVPERYLAGLVKGAKTPVIFDALGDREFAGVISQIVPKAAEGTHTIPVRVDVQNVVENGRPVIVAGVLAKVWLPVGAEHQALLVPKAAIIRQEGRDLVYTAADTPPGGADQPAALKNGNGSKPAEKVGPPAPPVQFAVAVPVRLIQGYGRFMEVESDKLKAGMPVVTRGTYLLSNGAAVQVYPKERTVEAPAAK